MAANTGRTHAKHITVKLDNSAGTLTDISKHVNTVGSIGATYETQDVTAWGDGTKNIVIGQPSVPLTIGGPWSTEIHSQMTGINGSGVPLSLDIQIGIRHAWEAGEPQFGISSNANSGYLCHAYTYDPGANTWSAQLDVYGSVAPEWGTAAES
ncbi:MAG TPA: hypothetical protein PKC99_14255 [Anaerolineales bacterium]|nr:hypothetical protein [Anaerolineales bacterium]